MLSMIKLVSQLFKKLCTNHSKMISSDILAIKKMSYQLLIFFYSLVNVTLSSVSPAKSGRVTESLVAEYSNLFPL